VDTIAKEKVITRALRLECLAAGDCYVCGRGMVPSSGGKWLCKACGFLLTCCDP